MVKDEPRERAKPFPGHRPEHRLVLALCKEPPLGQALVAHACKPSNWEAEGEGSGVQGQLWLLSKFKAAWAQKTRQKMERNFHFPAK